MAKENKRYYWLKFQEDFFSSLRVKKLRKLGSDYLIIYLEMQLFSLQTGGYMEYKGIEETFAQELALEIDEDPDKVQLTLAFLQSCGLLECTDENEYFLPYVEINTGSETASTVRSRACRARKQSQKALQCNTDATLLQQQDSVAMQHQCNTEIRDKSIDKKSVSKDTLEKDLSETSSDECAQTSDLAAEQKQKAEDLRVDQIVNEFNTVCKELPKVKKISPQRRKKVKTRLKSFTVQEIYQAFNVASYSSFLNGHNDSGWKATFDWFFENDSNITKVLEGNYNNKASPTNKASFNNFNQRKYDMKELEEKMLSG